MLSLTTFPLDLSPICATNTVRVEVKACAEVPVVARVVKRVKGDKPLR